MQRINVQPLARKPWIRQEAAAKLGNRNDGSASRTPIRNVRKRSGKAGYGRTNDGSFSFFFHDWSRDAIFFFFFFIDYCIRQTREISLLVRIDVRLIATENKLIATHKLKDQSVNWILQLLTEALSITASTGVDPLSRASSSCNQSRTCRASGWASGRT